MEDNNEDVLRALYPDLQVPQVEWREWFRIGKEVSALARKAEGRQERAVVDLRTADGPIAIAHSADWHLGSLGCDYDKLERDLDYLVRTPKLYLGTAGDLKDNFHTFKNVSAIHGQVWPPSIQNKVMHEITKYITEAGKLLWVTWDNHSDEFDERFIGYNAAQYIWESEKVLALDGEGYVEVWVGEARYTHIVTHKFRGGSGQHRLASAKTLYRERFPADVIVTAHTHAPAYEHYQGNLLAKELGKGFGGDSYLIRCGTYKTDDIHSTRYFGLPAIGTPTVVYLPTPADEKQTICFPDAEKAVTYMRGMTLVRDLQHAGALGFSTPIAKERKSTK